MGAAVRPGSTFEAYIHFKLELPPNSPIPVQFRFEIPDGLLTPIIKGVLDEEPCGNLGS
jgi:hypothetical protein